MAKMMVLEENFNRVFCGTDGAGDTCTWGSVLHWHEKGRGVGWLQGAVELWNLRIAVVRRGHATVLVGKGERIVWLKLESRHYEFLASDNSEEFKVARRAHIEEIAEIYKVAFSKLDCER